MQSDSHPRLTKSLASHAGPLMGDGKSRVQSAKVDDQFMRAAMDTFGNLTANLEVREAVKDRWPGKFLSVLPLKVSDASRASSSLIG